MVIVFVCQLRTNIRYCQDQWIQIGTDLDGEADGDDFGVSVSMSFNGNRIAIGGYFNDQSGNNRGHVRVFDFLNGNWIQVGQDIDGEADNDFSGYSVALSGNGNRVAVGAYGNDGGGVDRGHVRVFDFLNGNWVQVGQDIDGEMDSDFSGKSVAISSDGNRVAIGTEFNEGGGIELQGHVRIFELINGSWIQMGDDIDGESYQDLSGISTSLSSNGNRISIGAYGHDGGGEERGQVRIFNLVSGNWIQMGQSIIGEADNDFLGISTSLSSNGNRVAVGAYGNDGGGVDRGHVRVFDFLNGNWIQVGQDIDGEADGDFSGISVSLSGKGDRVAIGARTNDGGGSVRGHVRIYDFLNGNWIQVGQDIDGEADNDLSGYSISLSGNGKRVAIGADFNDGGGAERGHARVYAYCSQLNRIINGLLSTISLGGQSVLICHNGQTIRVGFQASIEHLLHGDLLGQCDRLTCDPLQLRNSDRENGNFALEFTKNELILFPNPVKNTLFALLPSNFANPDLQVQIVNQLGQTVLSKSLKNSLMNTTFLALELGNLPKGYYYFSAFSHGNMVVKPIVKI